MSMVEPGYYGLRVFSYHILDLCCCAYFFVFVLCVVGLKYKMFLLYVYINVYVSVVY
jgi:hypothetical protein